MTKASTGRGRRRSAVVLSQPASTSVGVAVLSFAAEMSDDEVRAIIGDATVAGRRAVIDSTRDAMRGAIDSAMHAATARGGDLAVVSGVRGVVSLRDASGTWRTRRLVVVRYFAP